ncbi:MAG TPA: error-prone DNA polymerase [Acetobacteraceae bacterium]
MTDSLGAAYVELQVTTNYSFLRGASHIEELFAQAAILGMPALGITDRNSLAGIVRAHQRAQEAGVRLIVGCRLDLTDGMSVLVYPTDRPAYSRLTRLLTIGKGRAGKGACQLDWNDLVQYGNGLIAILCAGITAENLRRLHADFGDRGYAALIRRRRPDEAVRLRTTADLAHAAHVATVATNDVLYHVPHRRILQDVVTCIREGCTIDDAGFRRERSVDRHLLPPGEAARLFSRHADAVARTREIADCCQFSLDELRYQYPHETRVPGLTAQQTLERLTWEGTANRYPGSVPENVKTQLRHELGLIDQLGYAPYFLTVHNIVRFARAKEILCQGRGSAANSAVCYVLGITAIDPVRGGLLFERFISTDRKEPPDIDVDFEHERREEVIQWIYKTYGARRAALCATVIRYRSRGAVREVGKALGLTDDVTGALASQASGWSEEGVAEEDAAALNFNMQDRRLRLTLELTRLLIGFPRHLSQHPGGFVLTEDRLDELVPIEPASMVDRQVIEWDKDDIDALRFMKVDVLGLGMLGCMRRAFDLLAKHRGVGLGLATIPPEDPATYAMIRKADTLGTFQIESRAQMSMLPRLKPRTFYDLVIQVAIVRPGPIQGDMVHPYLRRREGREPVDYPRPELRQVLGKTLGVPLFQEQAMQVAIACAGFTPSEADALRRSMATFKSTGGVSHFKEKLITGMIARGYEQQVASKIFSQIEGFGSYGFPESHAASFALIAYASAWLKCHHPDVFCCALLNAQPMGFYAPAQIVRDARDHGVEVRPVSVNASEWDCTLESSGGSLLAVRLGFRMAKGLAETHAAQLIDGRGAGYRSVRSLWQRVAIPIAALERLAEADAFGALGVTRREALWAIRGLSDTRLPLFDAAIPSGEDPGEDGGNGEAPVSLVPMTAGREVVEDYRSVRLSLRQHPVAFLRADLDAQRIVRCADLAQMEDGKRLSVAGIVLVRQRPGSARGVLFVTIEDETGHANLIVWSSVFEAQRRLVLSARMLACRGKLQREGAVIHVIAEHLTDLSGLLQSVGERETEFPVAYGRGDELTHGNGVDHRWAESADERHIRVADRRAEQGNSKRGIKVSTRDFR